MKGKTYLLSLLFLCLGIPALADTPRYVGGDISLLPDYEAAKAQYRDQNGAQISDLLTFCYDEGMNCMRVRLFVNPDDYAGSNKDANAKQDLDYILPLCKRIKEAGFDLMLDFHYSDTWADPVAQWTPKAWENLSDAELIETIYEYTAKTLRTLNENGATPDFIQPGNEISYGMLWGPYGTSNPKKVYANSGTNWTRFGLLLSSAVKACRQECPDAKIILHTERVAQVGTLTNFYNKMKELNVDYDIIGLSYYPYFHGTMNVLETALNTVETEFPDKQIMIVETGYSYAWEVPGTNQKVDYPYTETGQNQFAQDLVDTLLRHESVTGLFWWWMEYNAYRTSLTGWYNAPLFDSRTGKVTKAFHTICSFGTGHADAGINYGFEPAEPETEVWYDLQGRRLQKPTAPGLYIRNNEKILIR